MCSRAIFLRVYLVLSTLTTFGAGYWDFKKVETLRAEKTQLSVSLTNTVQKAVQLSNTLVSVKQQSEQAEQELGETRQRALALEENFQKTRAELVTTVQRRKEVEAALAQWEATSITPQQTRELQNTARKLQDKVGELSAENDQLKRFLNKSLPAVPK
jgi:chromosome segregation ATPase